MSAVPAEFHQFEGLVIQSDKDPVFDQIRALCETHSFRCRVWFPGSKGSMDVRRDRLNFHVTEEPTGLKLTHIRIG